MFNAIRRWIQGAIASTIVKQAAYIEQLERESDKGVERYTQVLNHNLELITENRALRKSHHNILKLQTFTFSTLCEIFSELEEMTMVKEDFRRLYNEAYDENLVLNAELKTVRITNGQLAELNMKKQERIEELESNHKKNLSYCTDLELKKAELEKSNDYYIGENEQLKAEVQKLQATINAVHKNLLDSVAEIAGY